MNPNYPQGGVVPNQNTMYPMANMRGSTYSAPLGFNQATEVLSGYDAKVDPMTGQEIPDANFARGGEVGLASLLASRGRGGDSMLVHMTPGEVQGLQSLALAHGGSLTINPETGLPEANFLKKLLPSIAGFTLNSLFPGLGTVGTSLVVAGVSGLAEGSFSKGLKAGLGAYSGASIREALSRVAAERAAAQELAKLGQATTQAVAKEGVKEAVGLTKEAVDLPAQAIKGLQIPAMRLGQPASISMPGLSSDSIRALSSAIGESAAATRPTFSQLGQGLRSLTERGGLENFVTALGGPQKAGFVLSPITQAIEESELEEQERKMRRAQQGGSEFPYYIPGSFDFATGSFAPGAYYTRSGQPYKPKKPFGFADGGIVDLVGIDPRNMPGRDPIIMYPPNAPQPITPPSVAATQAFSFPQPRDVRRDITDQYIYDLNARLARGIPQYEESVIAPPVLPPVAPPTMPPINIPIVPPSFLPPGFAPKEEPIIPVEPEIQNYFPVRPIPPVIDYPIIPSEPEKKPSVEIEALPETIAPDYVGTPIIPVRNLFDQIPVPQPEEQIEPEKKPSVEIEALPETIAPEYQGLPIAPVQDFTAPFISEEAPDRRGVISYDEIVGLPPGFIMPPEPQIPTSIDLSELKDIGIDPNVTKALEEAAKEEAAPTPSPKEEKSTTEKVLDMFESGGGGLGALIGAGRELFGPGETNLRDFFEAAARGYLPDIFEKPAEEFVSKFGVKTEELTPEEAAKADAEALAKKEAEAEKEKTQVEPEQELIAPVAGGGGGGGFEEGFGGPSNYYDNSLQNFLDQYFIDQLMGGRGVVTVEELGMAGGGRVKHYAGGGLGSLNEYRAGGKFLQGPGDGMSDDIHANIDGKQEARLADGEFVIPADVVSHLGNGSSNAGAKKLYEMMARVRQSRTGKKKQAPAVNMNRHLPA
jgi:hypothetical protein